MKLKQITRDVFCAAALMCAAAGPATAAGKQVQLKGELIDTWCYVSQIMGASDFIVGTAHHACAVWCAAGGIPVGLLTDDGTVYMVMKYGNDPASVAPSSVIGSMSHVVTVKGKVHERDGINYLFIDEIVADDGITKLTHETVGVIPPFAVPK